MSYAGVERDPSWVEWAENETVARLRDQLRAKRASERGDGPDGPLAEISALAEAASSDLGPPEPADHPQRTAVTALSEPPDRDGVEWHDWAEAQTVLRLQQRPRRSKRTIVVPRRPVERPVEVPVGRIVRIHHDNLRAVGI